jgi:protein involved in sex pheromone biosynthesis
LITTRGILRFLPILLLFSLLLGCIPQNETIPEDNALPEEPPSVVAPSVQVEEKYYRGLSPFIPSTTRGSLLTVNTLQNYRLDASRVEFGLLEIAQEHFPIETHLFTEGEYISRDELNKWLRIKSDLNKEGLNPEGSKQRILRHILEHNYTNLKGEKEGVVIALSLASTYQAKQEDQEITLIYTNDELRNHGAKMADELVQRLRKKVPELPIVVALYQLEESNSLVPGSFLSVGLVEKEQNYVSSWKSFNEVFLLFPSQALNLHDYELAVEFSNFRQDVQEFYPNFVGITGKGRFIDEKLVELTLQVTTEFASKTEAIQLTQFLGGTAIERFPSNVHLNIYVQAVNQPQSIFIRPVEGESVMHVYR